MPSAAARNEDRRSSRRWIINEKVELVVGDKAYDFQITDMSTGGARVISEVDLEPGMKVVLQLPGPLQLTAKVVHIQSNGAGIQFEIGSSDRAALFDWISEASRLKNGG